MIESTTRLSAKRKRTLVSGPVMNLLIPLMLWVFLGIAGAPHWAAGGLGWIAWLIMEVHRDLLSAIEHQTSGKAD